jgi:class 3 adenylate cyclase
VLAAPRRDDTSFGDDAVQCEVTVLATDIRQYSTMTNAFGRQAVVQMLRAFLSAAVWLVVENSGGVADFNGDGMVLVTHVGVADYRDFAWVGQPVNTAAKAVQGRPVPGVVIISRDAYDRLGGSRGISLDAWRAGEVMAIGGVRREVLHTSQSLAP